MTKYNVNDIAKLITEDPDVFCEMDAPPPAPMVSNYGDSQSNFKVGSRPGQMEENQWAKNYQKKIEAILRHRLNYGTDGDKRGPSIPADIDKAMPFFAKTCASHAVRQGSKDSYDINGYTFFGPGEGQYDTKNDKGVSATQKNDLIFASILDGFRVANKDYDGKGNPKMFEMLWRIKDYEASLPHIANTDRIRSHREELDNRPLK